VTKDKLTFPILSDPDGAVLRAYDVLHARGGPGESDIAVPAQFLVRRDGSIAWRFVSTRIQSRSDPADTLAAVTKLAQ
jgi:peroxiredoxin